MYLYKCVLKEGVGVGGGGVVMGEQWDHTRLTGLGP